MGAWKLGLLVAVLGCASEEAANEIVVDVDSGATTSDAGGGRDGTTVTPMDASRTDAGRPAGDGAVVGDSAAARDAAGSDARTGVDRPTTLPDGAVIEQCDNGNDDDRDGMIDEGCACAPGAMQSCMPGDPSLAGVGGCRRGMQRCDGIGEFGTWGACTGAGLPMAEACNGVDDDCDGRVDEECTPCIDTPGSSTPWQMHLGAGPSCFGRTFGSNGETGEYAFASIPPESDPGWAAHASDTISFDDPSTLCGVCECRAGGDFTYFQTTFYVPAAATVSSLRVTIGTVDDGVSVTVYNSMYPAGIVDPGAYAFLGGGSTADLARYIVAGRNRVVLTHVDDCCSVRAIRGATITLNGMTLNRCGPM